MEPKRALERVFHGIAGVGPLLFFAVATVEGQIRRGYDPIAEPISALALGPRGWIQDCNFLLFAASLFAFVVVLRSQFRTGVSSVAAPGVFLLMTIGILLAEAFTMDGPGESPTLVGRLHTAAGFLVFPWMSVALLLVARRFRREERWRPYLTYTLATGIFCLATIAFFLLFVGTPDSPPRVLSEFRGLVQRVMLFPFLTWIAIVTHRAYRGAHESSAAVPGNDATHLAS